MDETYLEPKNVGIIFAFKDLLKRNSTCDFLWFFLISILFLIIMVIISPNSFYNNSIINNTGTNLPSMALSILPSMAGLVIAGFAFILASKLPDKLNKNSGNGYTYYDEICANFAFAIILQICTIIYALIFEILRISNIISIYALFFLMIFSFLLTINLVLNMYTTRELLLKGSQKDVTDKNDNLNENVNHNKKNININIDC